MDALSLTVPNRTRVPSDPGNGVSTHMSDQFSFAVKFTAASSASGPLPTTVPALVDSYADAVNARLDYIRDNPTRDDGGKLATFTKSLGRIGTALGRAVIDANPTADVDAIRSGLVKYAATRDAHEALHGVIDPLAVPVPTEGEDEGDAPSSDDAPTPDPEPAKTGSRSRK